MRQTFLAIAAAATVLIAAPAVAQDEPAGEPSATFTGPRVEALAGYDKLGSDSSIQGLAFGGGVGFDFAIGGIAAGIEGEYMDSTGARSSTDEDFGLRGTLRTGRDLYVGGRVGFQPSPTTLIYAKGGYTNADLEFAFVNTADSEDRIELTSSVDGYRIGAGVEQAIETPGAGAAFVKLEYRYSNYSGIDLDNGDLDGLEEADLDTDDLDLDRHQVIFGVGLRF